MLNSLFAQNCNVQPVFPISDAAAGALTGDFINISQMNKLVLLWDVKAGGTAGEDPVLTILQAPTNGGATSALVPRAVYKKQAATSLAAVGVWTEASAELTANALSNATLAEQAALYAIEIHPEDLAAANSWVTATVADVGTGNAKWMSLLAIGEPKYFGDPAALPSLIA